MPRVKLANGALRDQIRQDLFDTVTQEIGASITGITKFFAQVQGKASYLTNLRQNNILENQVSYLVQGLGFDAHVFAPADFKVLPLLVDHAAVKLRIGEKVYWEGPLRYIVGKINQDGAGSLTAYLAQFGSHDASKYALKGNDSIAIPPLQTFGMELEVAGYTAAEETASLPSINRINYVARLMGLLRRPVQ